MGTVVSLARYRARNETPEPQHRIAKPMTVAYKIVERAPHERPYPDMPEILQPDMLDMLHRLQQGWIARQGAAGGW